MYQDKLLFKAETVQLLGGEYEVVMQIHSYLSAQRKAVGLRRQMVASAAGIDLRQYQRLESGERSMCSASLRIGLAVCDVLGLDSHRFVPMRPQVQTDSADERQYIYVEKRPNGAGKSTLIQILTTYLRPTTGMIQVLGKDGYSEAAAIRPKIACVAQKISIDTYLSLTENMMFQSRIYKIPKVKA